MASSLVLFGVASGCGPDGSSVQDSDGQSSGAQGSATEGTPQGTDGLTSSNQPTSAEGPGPATSPGTTGPGTTGSDDDDEGNSFIAPETTTGPTEPQPNGAMCQEGEDCESGFCYFVPALGRGACSECVMDQDCEAGTCSLDIAAMSAVCTDGGLGVMCNTDEGCGGELVCSEVLDLGGFGNFCSECGPDTACTDDEICSPVFDAGMGQASLRCVPPGSVPSGGNCPLDGAIGNDEVCENGGFCTAVQLSPMLPVDVGVCGECGRDSDCAKDQSCTPGTASLTTGFTGARCE